jgi:hypothetical protein
MMADSTSRTPPPRCPGRRNGAAAPPGWNLPTQSLAQQRKQPRGWSPLVMIGGITALIACFAVIVVMVAR